MAAAAAAFQRLVDDGPHPSHTPTVRWWHRLPLRERVLLAALSLEQGGDTWHALRAPLHADDCPVIIGTSSAASAVGLQDAYCSRAELARRCRGATPGQPAGVFQSAAMRWGHEMEPVARQALADALALHVVEVGSITFPLDERLRLVCSPDGVALDPASGRHHHVELKCPTRADPRTKLLHIEHWVVQCMLTAWALRERVLDVDGSLLAIWRPRTADPPTPETLEVLHLAPVDDERLRWLLHTLRAFAARCQAGDEFKREHRCRLQPSWTRRDLRWQRHYTRDAPTAPWRLTPHAAWALPS